MLYERWRQIADAHRDEIALRDLSSGLQWTFSKLATVAEERTGMGGTVAYVQGNGVDFIFSVLRAWHCRQVVCPLEASQASPDCSPPLPAGIVHLKTTSATTGEPRLVAFTAAQLMADADNIVSTMGLGPDWPNLGVISLAHSYGFSNLILPLLLHGIPLILAESPLPEMLRRAAASEPAVTLAGVPALWRTWHEAKAISPSIRLAISAGAPLPLSLEQSVFAAQGLKIHNFYGSTECGGIAYDAATQPRVDGASAGSPMRNVQLSVAEDGCLEVRGAAVGQTYWPEPDSNLQDRTFHTSDLAEISCGLVYLRGRAGDQINIAGRKVSPEAIEKILLMHPQVKDCLVFGVPSAEAERTEKIVACVVNHAAVSSDALRQFLLERLPAWQVPRECHFVDALAINERGKISRAQWRKTFLASHRSELKARAVRH